MATGDKKANLYPKKNLSFEVFKEQILDLYLKQVKDHRVRQYPKSGVFSGGGILPGDNPNTIKIKRVAGQDVFGNEIVWPANGAEFSEDIPFENEAGATYHVALKFIETVDGVEVNPRTGKFHYKFIKEAVGEQGQPDQVEIVGEKIVLTVDSIVQPGVNHKGRKVKIYLTEPETNFEQGDNRYFDIADIVFEANHNKVILDRSLGQTEISNDRGAYIVELIGPFISKNVALPDIEEHIILGSVVGNGFGNIPEEILDIRNILLSHHALAIKKPFVTVGIEAGTADFTIEEHGEDAIQQAIINLGDDGGLVFIRKGKYELLTPIEIEKDNVFIQGEGNATQLFGFGDVFSISASENIKIMNLKLRGQAAVIRVSASRNVHIENNFLEDQTGNLMLFSDFCEQLFVTHNVFLGSGSIIANSNLCQISENVFVLATLTLDSCNSNKIINNHFDIQRTATAGPSAIFLDKSESNIISNNKFEDTLGGLILQESSNNTIMSNSFEQNFSPFVVEIGFLSSGNIFVGNNCHDNDIGIIPNSIHPVDPALTNIFRTNIIGS